MKPIKNGNPEICPNNPEIQITKIRIIDCNSFHCNNILLIHSYKFYHDLYKRKLPNGLLFEFCLNVIISSNSQDKIPFTCCSGVSLS